MSYSPHAFLQNYKQTLTVGGLGRTKIFQHTMGFFDKLKGFATDVASSASTKLVVEKVVELDYSTIYGAVTLLGDKVPASQKPLPVISVLHSAAIQYKESDSDTKDSEFIDRLVENIDAEQVLCEVEPYVGLIPGGGVFIMLLKFIVNIKKQ